MGGNSQYQYRANKKHSGSTQCDFDIGPHISLEWSQSQKRVVARREQICISRKDLTHFNDFFPNIRNIMADVCTIPSEIFELDNLAEVLSYEVWQTRLSEKERSLLMQFLPKGLDAEQVVQSLLASDNFHFGNPFDKWGVSLCSGNLHPDAILQQEKCLKTNKKAYYSELQTYHNDMIRNLQKLKKRCESCKDSEMDFVPKLWRSRKHTENSVFAPSYGSKIQNSGENLGATSESCSGAADEKACSSDNQFSSIMKSGKLPRRKGLMEDKCQNLLVSSDNVLKAVARPRKVVKLNKHFVRCTDGAKYMSYVKISKKQYQLIKSMKQSGKSIPSRSLNRVLGDLDRFHVQPYEVFEEEEQKKLHEHWLQVAKRDLPAAYTNWRKGQSHKCQVTKSLEQEFKEKLKSLMEDEYKEYAVSELQAEKNDVVDREAILEDDESIPASSNNLPAKHLHSLNASHTVNTVDVDSENIHVNKTMDVNSENNHFIFKADVTSPDTSEYTGNLKPVKSVISHEVPLSSSQDVWPGVSLPHTFYQSVPSREYTSSSGLSIEHSQLIEGNQPCMIDLESDLRGEDGGATLLHRQQNNGAFSSYQSQDQREHLQSFYRGQEVLSYNQEQKHTGLDFLRTGAALMGSSQLQGHFQERIQQPLPLEQRLKRQNEFYMHQNIHDNMYSNGGRYLMPREHVAPINVHDWAVNPVRMPTLQSHSNGGESHSQNWISGQHRVRGGFSGLESACVQNQHIGNGSNNEENLFSVLSHCKDLQSSNPYDSMGSSEQFISSRNFGVMDGGIPRNSNVLPQTAHPFDYMSGREAQASPMTNNVGWVSLPHPNYALHDSMGKPFLRSWNQ